MKRAPDPGRSSFASQDVNGRILALRSARNRWLLFLTKAVLAELLRSPSRPILGSIARRRLPPSRSGVVQ